MADAERSKTPDPLVELYNDLANELNADMERLDTLKRGRELEEITGDPSLNYLQGKVTGFELAMNALQAHIIVHKADQAGKLELSDTE